MLKLFICNKKTLQFYINLRYIYINSTNCDIKKHLRTYILNYLLRPKKKTCKRS